MKTLPDEIADRLPAAAALLADQGFEHTRVDDIADLTGVPRATLYYHFAGKEEILSHLLGSMLDTLAARVQEAAGGLGSARQRLGSVIHAQLELMAADPATSRRFLNEMDRVRRIPDLRSRVRAAFHEPFARLLADGEQDQSLRAVDIETTTSAVFGSIVFAGLHHIVVYGGFHVPEIQRAVESLVLSGLERRSDDHRSHGA